MMSCGNLGSTIFTFAGLMVNASQYKQKIDQLLDDLFAQEVTDENVNKFKLEAEEAAMQCKAFSGTSNTCRHHTQEVNDKVMRCWVPCMCCMRG